ncbi:CHAT domain-containing protein [Suillus paluster]|uniref:CHAT domain-containing protein n=1 Tax=Suillus paluster TaxID=48578 RepID=UPI001B866021|nr:CHAT domain-containing protein [Suillus paluster]KAG1724646.1 CHAT domain-containing protein [Suillus paluster]
MLGLGEVVGKLETSWNELLDHGDQPFDISFPTVDHTCPSLTLKVAFVGPCGQDDGALLESIIECNIARHTDAGHARCADYVASKSISHLNDALGHFQLVLDQCPVGHPDRAAALANLACARLGGYSLKDLQDIDFTTSLFRDALALRPQGHPDHSLSLCNLISVVLIWHRHNKECTAVNIQEFAQLCCELLALCPEATYLRSISVDTAVNYVIHECNNLPIDPSDEGIQLRRIVLELCPVGHQHHLKALDELSWGLRERFTQLGSIDDLDESIQLLRDIASLCPEGCHDRDTYLHNLAFSIAHRFSHQGNSHDLDEVISLYEEVLRLCPVGHDSRDTSLDNLGGAFVDRFNQSGDVNDINRAISLYREALTLRPPGNASRDITLNNLARALKTRYDKFNVSEDLNEAVDLYRESLRLTQHDHPDRHAYLRNLSSALCSWFTHTQKDEDVEEAIGLCRESLAALPPLHPDRCTCYARLQEAYLSRYGVHHDPGDLSLAVEHFRLASRHPTQGFPGRIKTALLWVHEAEKHQHESALEAYHECLDLFDNHVMTRSSVISRREAATAFLEARTLPVDATSCAIRRDNLRQAVELEERGRGQQWSLTARLRTPLEDLESVNPKLAHRFSELSKRLSDAQGSAVSTDRAAADQAAIRYRRFTTQWEAAVAEIRNVQGFSQFLLPPSYKDLQAAASYGPVIILIASKYSCEALVVPTSGQPHRVPFPSVALEDLKMLKSNFAKAIRHASCMGPKEPRTALIALLRKIWDEVMLPIVKVLQRDLKLPRRSRIWLCPTAAFTSIPLHAAHPFRTKADGCGREPCLEDLYICSYTPTLSALIRSRQMMKNHCAMPSFVAIGQSQPGAGQGEALLAVESELALVRKLVPVTANPTTLSGDAATRAGALEALQCNTWVHLACHGKQDREQPYNSHFAMRDQPLTLLDIMENDAPQAEFAFLSACHTAVGDEEMPDEVIHLAAGLQFSGFKSVIGTLWVVDDAVARHIVEAFYEDMFKDLKDGVIDCTKAALALNHATCAVKKEVPLEQRIVFIHIGV